MRWEAWTLIVLLILGAMQYVYWTGRQKRIRNLGETVFGLCEYVFYIVLVVRLGSH